MKKTFHCAILILIELSRDSFSDGLHLNYSKQMQVVDNR